MHLHQKYTTATLSNYFIYYLDSLTKGEAKFAKYHYEYGAAIKKVT